MTDDVVTLEALPLGQAMLCAVLSISWLSLCAQLKGFGLLSSMSALSDLSNGTRPGTDLELFLASLGL